MSAYYIEILDNLQVVDIYAKSTSSTFCNDIQLSSSNEIQIGKTQTIQLPIEIVPLTSTRTTLPNSSTDEKLAWVRIRAPIASISKKERLEKASQLIANIEKPVTAKTIKDGLRDIQCKACHDSLLCAPIYTSKLLSIRDLPSSYWSEMVDCWVCHPEEDLVTVNKDLLHSFESDTMDGTVLPSPSGESNSSGVDVWIGDTYALVVSNIFKELPSKAIQVDAKDRFINTYVQLQCAHCNYVLGECGRMGDKRFHKLFLHRVSLNILLSSKHELVSLTLSQNVCREILAHTGAHAVYKFVIEGRNSCKPKLLIQIVGWNTDVMAADGQRDFSLSRCIKVLYRSEIHDATFANHAEAWLNDNATELVSLLDDDCIDLLQLLQENALLIPEPLRKMNEMTRSLLQMS